MVIELGVVCENVGEEVVHNGSIVAENARVELEIIFLGDGVKELVFK